MEPTDNIVKLPFVETVKRSFLYFFDNIEIYIWLLSLGAVALAYEMFSDFPVLCSFSGRECAEGSASAYGSSLLLTLISIVMIVSYCRVVILKKQPLDIFNREFGRQTAFYFLLSLLFGLFVAILFMLVLFMFGILSSYLAIPPSSFWTPVILLAIMVALLVPLAGVFLIFPGIAVNDPQLSISKYRNALKLARGNTNAIFWGQLLMMVPGAVGLYILMEAYTFIGVNSYFGNLVFAILTLALSFLDSCLKASFFAHIYQFFTYYRDKT